MAIINVSFNVDTEDLIDSELTATEEIKRRLKDCFSPSVYIMKNSETKLYFPTHDLQIIEV